MSLSDEEREALVAYRLEKARNTYEQTVTLIPMGYWNIIANRLYYSAYYAVSALLLNEGHNVQTHNGIIQMLGYYFVKTGKISKELATNYGRLFSLRQTGDYGDTFDLTEQDVKPLVEPTKQIIDIATEIIYSDRKQ